MAYRAFIKREHVVYDSVAAIKPHGVPRLIQGRSEIVKVATGPFTHSYAKELRAVWNNFDFSFIVYAIGFTAEQLGAYVSWCVGRGYDLFFDIDMKRFDSCVHPEFLRLLHRIYLALGAAPELMRIFHRRLSKRGITAHNVLYLLQGQVGSGDGDTSGSDTTFSGWMLLSIIEELCTIVRCHVSLDLKFRALDMGDDVLILTSRLLMENRRIWLDQVYRSFGFLPEISVHLNLYGVSFCSSRFWPTNTGLVLGPKIGRIISKTFWSIDHVSDRKSWVKGICLGLLRECSFVPVLRVLLPHLISLCGGVVAHPHFEEYKFHAKFDHEACSETWDMMFALYGLCLDQILELERFVVQVSLGQLITHPYLETICNVDLSF